MIDKPNKMQEGFLALVKVFLDTKPAEEFGAFYPQSDESLFRADFCTLRLALPRRSGSSTGVKFLVEQHPDRRFALISPQHALDSSYSFEAPNVTKVTDILQLRGKDLDVGVLLLDGNRRLASVTLPGIYHMPFKHIIILG